MKFHIKSFTFALLIAGSIAGISVYLIYKNLKSDFEQQIITEKTKLEVEAESKEQAEEDSIPADCAKAYQDGFMDCLLSVSPNTYSAFLHSFIDYGGKPMTNADYQTLADSYQLDEDEVAFLKGITRSAENTE